MGNDDPKGLGPIKEKGMAIVQGEPSRMAWGIPRSTVETGHLDIILPLDEVSETIAIL